uniref:hypothetical protein n=1 Tax=Rhodococcus oryzae TaxID=2571143 RepID=UPI00145CBC18|nr:hypothetical protein [Rhodococcus oryzae]
MELHVGPTKAYEAILTDVLTGGSRAESRVRPQQNPSRLGLANVSNGHICR